MGREKPRKTLLRWRLREKNTDATDTAFAISDTKINNVREAQGGACTLAGVVKMTLADANDTLTVMTAETQGMLAKYVQTERVSSR